MNIYLAGSYKNRMKIRKWMQILREKGHKITEDWTYHETSTNEIEFGYAVNDMDGVCNCDFFILDTEGNSNGKMIELGMALATMKRIAIIGKLTTIFRFLIHSDNYFETFENLLKVI